MYVGRIWARSGGAPPSPPPEESGRISTGASEKSSANLKAGAPVVTVESLRRAEIKKNLKKKRIKTLQALKKVKVQKTALNEASPVLTAKKEDENKSEDKTTQPQKTELSKVVESRQTGRNWHHKQELYDVECSQKLARVVATYFFDREARILGSTVSPDPQWYHIYPGSLEEKLYVELCRPSQW
jgi:hypothetical protein